MSACRSCEAPVIWCFTEKGKKMPVDVHGGVGGDGSIVLRDGAEFGHPGEKVAVVVPAGAFPDEPHYTSHFATCPNANQHRRSKEEER